MSLHRLGRAIIFGMLLTAVLPLCHATGNVVQKVALVIGNQRYAEDKPLPNAINDVNLMAKTLTGLGFAVTQRQDLNRTAFAAAVTEFAARIPEGATALVYYAGHGMQIGGNNYLNPVDMQLTSEVGAQMHSYSLKQMLESLARSKSAVNIVILDACRNNPFQPQGAVRYRSFGNRGLSRVQAPRGTLVAYSTGPGLLAADGTEGNSVYTAALARHLTEPGQEIEKIFKRVATEVRKKTFDDQIPWYDTSLTDEYYLKPPEGVTVVAGKPLKYASAGNVNGTAVRRGRKAAPNADEQWYRQMTASEWSQIDWEIQQRVKRLTPDEIPLLEHKAGAGNVMAQTTLGLAHREGIDRARHAATGQVMRFKANNTKALRWLNKAADAGFPVAQAELGEMYYAGHGVDRDLQASRHWMELAAAAEYPRAKLDLLQLNMEISPREVDARDALESVMKSLRISPAQR